MCSNSAGATISIEKAALEAKSNGKCWKLRNGGVALSVHKQAAVVRQQRV
jgi:hypothetical protein